MSEDQRKKAPQAEPSEFEKQRPLTTGDESQKKHTEAEPMSPIVPGC